MFDHKRNFKSTGNNKANIWCIYSAEKPGTYMQTMNLCPAGLDKHF